MKKTQGKYVTVFLLSFLLENTRFFFQPFQNPIPGSLYGGRVWIQFQCPQALK